AAIASSCRMRPCSTATSRCLTASRLTCAFCFSCSRVHRLVHSFPTRRSSDLPAIGGLGTAPELEHVDTVLANGLRVLAVRKANVPMVETRLSIPFGGDSPEHTATAEVLAETILTCTGRRDRVGIDTELSLIGGELNTVVDPERLAIAGGCLTTGLSTLLDVLADALGNASH